MLQVRTLPAEQPPPPVPAGPIHLDLFGHAVDLHLTRRETREHFDSGYVCLPGPGRGETLAAVELSGDGAGLLVGRTEYRWQGSLRHWPLVLEMLLHQHLLREDTRQVVFHGAALSAPAGGLCLLGPPGSGKSTLALCLAAVEGHDLLSDEFAWVTPDGTPGAFPRRPRLDGPAHRLLSRAGVTPIAQAGHRPARPPAPIRFVFLLGAEQAPAGEELAVTGPEASVARIAAASGARLTRRHDHWHLALGHTGTGGLAELAVECWRNGLFVLGAGQPAQGKGFEREPHATALSASEGVFAALPHLRSIWPEVPAGEVVGRVATAVGKARFYRLRVGPLLATRHLLLALTGTQEDAHTASGADCGEQALRE